MAFFGVALKLYIHPEHENIHSNYREWRLGTFSAPEVYTAGEFISHIGKDYVVLQTHFNYGDSTWSPVQANALFRLK